MAFATDLHYPRAIVRDNLHTKLFLSDQESYNSQNCLGDIHIALPTFRLRTRPHLRRSRPYPIPRIRPQLRTVHLHRAHRLLLLP